MQFIYCLFIIVPLVSGQYEVPDAIVEVFSPRGLKVSIPDEDGIKLFAFHGNINKEFDGLEAGEMAKDILKPKNGYWTFYDPTKKLKVGDTLHYWTYVDYFDGTNKLGYQKLDQKYEVRELKGATTTTKSPSTKPTFTVRPIVDETNKPSNGNCGKSVTVFNGAATCSGQLIFNETFDGDVKKSPLWNVENKFAGSPDYEFVWYSNLDKSMYTKNVNDRKVLEIKPILLRDTGNYDEIDLKDRCTGIIGTTECYQKQTSRFPLPPIISTQINTKNKFSFKYGRIEIRAKLPKGDWIYPELYLNPLLQKYGPGYASGQMRVAFYQGNADSSNVLYGGAILGDTLAARNYGMKDIVQGKEKTSWGDDFHTYELIWLPDSITVSVDGKIYGNLSPPPEGFAVEKFNLNIPHADNWKKGTIFAPFDEEMYIVLGVGAGGLNFNDKPSKPWINYAASSLKNFVNALDKWHGTWSDASALQVDYVRVWAI